MSKTRKKEPMIIDMGRIKRGIKRILETLTLRKTEDPFLGSFFQLALGGYKGTAISYEQNFIHMSLLNPIQSLPKRRRE